MNKENETISDIVAEMKNLVKSNGTKSRTNIPTLTIRAWLSLANRIEAAYKREVADLTRECERLKEERNRSGLAARAEVSERLHALTKENARLRAALKPVLACKVRSAMTAETEPGRSDYCSNIIEKAQRVYNESNESEEMK